MTFREFIEAEIRKDGYVLSDFSLALQSLLEDYDAAHPPVTLETLPGELERLGLGLLEEADSNGRTITVKRASCDGSPAEYRCEVWVSHLGATVAVIQKSGSTFDEVDVLFTNPADALELVKLLVKGAEGE